MKAIIFGLFLMVAFDLYSQENRFDKQFAEADKAFNNKYNRERMETEMPIPMLDGSQGLYYTSPCRSWENKLAKDSITVCGETIIPGQITTLNDFFCRPIEYLGKDPDGNAIFYMGSKENSFFSEHYYEPVYVVTETRLFKIYSHNAGRDFNYIKNEWK